MMGSANPLRQQMINMMYLVLTALLALNVSAEILKAFQTVNVGMNKSISLIDMNNEHIMRQFSELEASGAAVGDFLEKAKQTTTLSDELYNYLEELKQKIVELSGGWEEKNGKMEMKGEKNLDIPSQIMIKEHTGDEVKRKMDEAYDKYISIISDVQGLNVETFKPNVTVKLSDPEGGKKTWAEESFHMVPTVAAVTLLTKIQQDVRTTQANIIGMLINSIGKLDFKFDQLLPVISVTSGKSAVAVGEKYECDILLAAYDSKQTPIIKAAGKELEVKAGKATYVGNTAQQGSFEIPVEIIVKNKSTGVDSTYPTKIMYDVFNAPAIISASNMNVFYIGLKNPVDVSVPGYRPTDLMVSMSGTGSIRQSKPGEYIVEIPASRGRPVNPVVNVSVKTPDGGTRHVGKKEFRIKNVPKPVAYFGSKASGEISPAEIRMVKHIMARMGDFAFEGIRFEVTRYEFLYMPKRGGEPRMFPGRGSALTSQMMQTMATPGRGDMIIITNIYVSAPGLGNQRLENGITLTVK
jgi:gliding motility-associated protein GldM